MGSQITLGVSEQEIIDKFTRTIVPNIIEYEKLALLPVIILVLHFDIAIGTYLRNMKAEVEVSMPLVTPFW